MPANGRRDLIRRLNVNEIISIRIILLYYSPERCLVPFIDPITISKIFHNQIILENSALHGSRRTKELYLRDACLKTKLSLTTVCFSLSPQLNINMVVQLVLLETVYVSPSVSCSGRHLLFPLLSASEASKCLH